MYLKAVVTHTYINEVKVGDTVHLIDIPVGDVGLVETHCDPLAPLCYVNVKDLSFTNPNQRTLMAMSLLKVKSKL